MTQSGFTIIELLVVFAIVGILSIAGVVSYVSYNNTQVLSSAALDVKAMFALAQSRAQSQVKPSSCGVNTLNGYEVHICGNGALCNGSDSYDLYVNCGPGVGTSYFVTGLVLPNGVAFANIPSTPFTFPSLTGPVTTGTFNLKMGSKTKTLTVTGTGLVTIQ